LDPFVDAKPKESAIKHRVTSRIFLFDMGYDLCCTLKKFVVADSSILSYKYRSHKEND